MIRFPSPRLRVAFFSALLVLLAAIGGAAAPEVQSEPNQGVAAVEPEGRPAPQILAAWDEFASRLAERPAVTWNRRSGAPESVFGRLAPSMSEAFEPAARRFLADNSDLFRLPGGGSDLSLANAVESPMGRHVTFRQKYRGVPVFQAEVKVHFNTAGEIVGVNNTSVPEIELDSVGPELRAREAIRVARWAAPATGDGGDPEAPAVELVVYASEGGGTALAWKVTLATGGPTWQVFVDAGSGEVLDAPKDINRYAQGTGQVFRVNAVVATQNNGLTDQGDAASAVPSNAYSLVTLQGLAGNGVLDGAFASSANSKKRASSSSNNFIFDRSDDGFSETMGYYHLDYAQRYIQSLGFANVNNRQQVFSVNKLKVDNSFYSPQSKDITYGTGGVDDAEDAEVIWHEYGHSIQDNQVPGFGSTLEAGSMGEGFGDYWAVTVSNVVAPTPDAPCVADWDSISYTSSTPHCLRRVDTAAHYPENLGAEVHRNGLIWSRALWDIRQALGNVKADTLILEAQFQFAADTTMPAAARATVAAAGILYGNSAADTVRSKFVDRGIL